ncbi:MAG: FAD-dependent oxidoreductase [Bosea sp.]|nr:FAD-dependent oxidoreductase [Bosea sp. (in: a-proteobacteria)]
MTEILTPDLCVIGAGSGGLSVAAAAALFGVPVVLVERHRMGGDCLNAGCVPSKALIAAGHRAHDIRHAGQFGIVSGAPQIHFARVHAHVHRVIGSIAPTDSVERFTSLGVRVIEGEARFIDGRTAAVGDIRIRPRRFVIATGSRPTIPPIPGLDSVPYLTNETVFDETARPDRLIVLGGGPIGVELGQAFRRLGSAVTLLQAGRILPRDDAEAAGYALRALRADGVHVREGARVERIEGEAGAIRAILASGEVVAGSHLLIAAGRTPSLEALDLAAAGVAHGRAGITVDRGLRTSNRRIYAIGDCATGATDGLQFTHAANHHAGIVIRSALFRLPAKVDNSAMPRVTYCDPEIASVGLTEDKAREEGRTFQVLRWPFAENDRAQAEGEPDGMIKIVTDSKGRILGATIAGKSAGDLLMPWVMAVQKRWTVQDIAGFIFPYPTFSEVSKRAALTHFSPMAGKPWIRRILGVLRKFG